MADEGSRPHDPAAPDPVTPARDGAPASSPPAATAAEDPNAALERERWLRDQIDKERMLLLLFGKHVVHALAHEPPILRFWRWLIDDLRSARREEAELLSGRREAGALGRLTIWLRQAWRGSRRRRPASG
jgi:hypothetical protein